MVCEMVVAVLVLSVALVCLLAVLGSTSPVVHVGCMSLRVCVV